MLSPEVRQDLVRRIDPDQTHPRELEVEDHVDRQRQNDHEADAVDEAPGLRPRPWRIRRTARRRGPRIPSIAKMIVGGWICIATVRVVVMSIISFSAGRSRIRAWRLRARRLDGTDPDLPLQRRRSRPAPPRAAARSGRLPVDLEARVQVAPEEIPHLRLSVRGQQVEPQVGGADRVRLLDDQVPPLVEAGGGSRET